MTTDSKKAKPKDDATTEREAFEVCLRLLAAVKHTRRREAIIRALGVYFEVGR